MRGEGNLRCKHYSRVADKSDDEVEFTAPKAPARNIELDECPLPLTYPQFRQTKEGGTTRGNPETVIAS